MVGATEGKVLNAVGVIASVNDALGACESVVFPIDNTVGCPLDPTVGAFDGNKFVPIFWLACLVGCVVCIKLGLSGDKEVGPFVGMIVGLLLDGVVALVIAILDGLTLCTRVGVGTGTGAFVGNVLDDAVELAVGTCQGTLLGRIVDDVVGKADEALVGIMLGTEIGIVTGTFVDAFSLGLAVGNTTIATMGEGLLGTVVRVGFVVLLDAAVGAIVAVVIGTLAGALVGATVNNGKSVLVGARLGVAVRA